MVLNNENGSHHFYRKKCYSYSVKSVILLRKKCYNSLFICRKKCYN